MQDLSGNLMRLGQVPMPETETYDWWLEVMEALLEPLHLLMEPGKATLPLKGQASNHGEIADRLEAFARPCLLAAHWLASEKPQGRTESLSREKIAEWFRQGLVLGTTPGSPDYWGPTANHHQHTVEMAALTLALQMARPVLWEPLTKTERQQILQWFASIRGAGLHRNNHMFFNVMTLAFLEQEGASRPADKATTRYLMDALEAMALGGGWFLDGMNETVDYYNAYAFHYYGLWWAKLYGHADHKRAARWKDWAGEFLKDYVHFFATSGENPPFGRSMCYRFAATAPVALAPWCGVSSIQPGLARRVCSRNLQFFLRQPIQQPQGALSLGWTDEFPDLTEAYSCAGSVYWAAKAFAPLLLPPSHAFWTSPMQELPAEKGDFTKAIPQAGLVVRSHAGDVEVLNNANGICVGNTKFGTWKWGKLAFRSGFGFNIGNAEDKYPLDAALTAEFEDSSIMGRHQCQPIAVTQDYCGSVYGLGDRFSQNHVSVETRIWWNGGWQLHWHHIHAWHPAVLRLATFTLPLNDRPAELHIGPGGSGEANSARLFASASNGERAIAIQSLVGFTRVEPRYAPGSAIAAGLQHSGVPTRDGQQSLKQEAHRVHVSAKRSLVFAAETDKLRGVGELLCLTWAGLGPAPRAVWTPVANDEGKLFLQNSDGTKWRIAAQGFPKFG